MCQYFGRSANDEDDEPGTEYLLKPREKDRLGKDKPKDDDGCDVDGGIGTEFLIKSSGKDDEPVVSVGSSRRRSSSAKNATPSAAVVVDESSQGDEIAVSKEITDIAADAMSLQPTGYTLETAHVSINLH